MNVMKRNRRSKPSIWGRTSWRTSISLLLSLCCLAATPAALASGEEQAGVSDEEPAPISEGDGAGDAAGAVRTPNVALARFTTSVENREPIDSVTFLSNHVHEVVFYSDLRDLSGTTVTHRWEYAGEVVAEVPFEVKGERWRVWSRKRLKPAQLGSWSVSIVSGDGEVLAAESFTYQETQ
jgi:hypothetical protein